ncbi:MAG TPA: hypothetical protein VMC79_08355 [Rectinemataceae bacterium]|nr:hypothetical protein [Rectinemataceae bacterium]
MVEAVSTNYLPLSYVYAARYGGGHLSLPVLRSEALYANFEHVSGVPAEDGMAAYSVDKLHILEVLINQLESVKTQPLAALEAPKDLSSGRVDALIQQYGDEMHALASAPAIPYAARPEASPGALFSLAA